MDTLIWRVNRLFVYFVILLLITILIGVLAGALQAGQVEVKEVRFLAIYGGAIREKGYNCPRVPLAYFTGPVARGNEAKVHCGPASGGVYKSLTYRVILTPSGAMIISPW